MLIWVQPGQVNSGISASQCTIRLIRLAEVHSLWEMLVFWIAEYIISHLFCTCGRLIIINGFCSWECS